MGAWRREGWCFLGELGGRGGAWEVAFGKGYWESDLGRGNSMSKAERRDSLAR